MDAAHRAGRRADRRVDSAASKTQEQKDIINLLKAPADPIWLLRAAFDAAMRDPAFKAEGERQEIRVDPISRADAQTMIEQLYSFPPDVIAKMQAALK